MNSMSLPPWFNRLLALALLLLMLALPLWLVLAPLIGLFSNLGDQRSSLEVQLERDERLASKLPQLRAKIEQFRSESDPEAALWTAETASLAAAAMQTLVMQSASTYQVQVTTAQTLPVLMDRELEKIAVVVDLTATLGGLQQLLYALESHVPALFIQSLSIRSQNPGVTQMAPPSEPILDIRTEIVGYRLPLQGGFNETPAR